MRAGPRPRRGAGQSPGAAPPAQARCRRALGGLTEAILQAPVAMTPPPSPLREGRRPTLGGPSQCLRLLSSAGPRPLGDSQGGSLGRGRAPGEEENARP